MHMSPPCICTGVLKKWNPPSDKRKGKNEKRIHDFSYREKARSWQSQEGVLNFNRFWKSCLQVVFIIDGLFAYGIWSYSLHSHLFSTLTQLFLCLPMGSSEGVVFFLRGLMSFQAGIFSGGGGGSSGQERVCRILTGCGYMWERPDWRKRSDASA